MTKNIINIGHLTPILKNFLLVDEILRDLLMSVVEQHLLNNDPRASTTELVDALNGDLIFEIHVLISELVSTVRSTFQPLEECYISCKVIGDWLYIQDMS